MIHMSRLLGKLVLLSAAVICAALLNAGIGVSAQSGVYVHTASSQYDLTVGTTIRIAITIDNDLLDTIRSTGFRCASSDPSVIIGASISQLPGAIASRTQFTTEQFYRATAPGGATIVCTLTATNLATGESIQVSSPGTTIRVSSETRLRFTVYTASQVATVGQAVYVNAVYSNVGRTTFTNISIHCVEILGAVVNTFNTHSGRTTLPPGQSSFQQDHWIAAHPGIAEIGCELSAIDTATGVATYLYAPSIRITVR